MNLKRKHAFIFHDISIVALSVLVAVLLVETNALSGILTSTAEWKGIGSFIAGIFFTSVFTTAPSIVALGEIARVNSLLFTAFFGACGALLGDLLIFRFVRDKVSIHFTELLQHNSVWRRFKVLFKMKYFRWGTFLVGGLIIASPLPDELGVSLLGLSKMKTPQFAAVSFVFNFLGILLIGIVARAI